MRRLRRWLWLILPGACVLGMTACQIGFAGNSLEEISPLLAPQEQSGPIIETDSELPNAYPKMPYQFRFRGHGGVSALHWHLEKGALPPGMKLEDDGFLHGEPEHEGDFQFTLSISDASNERGVQKGFVLRVLSAFSLVWRTPARVNGNRIDGSVEVSNMTPFDMDLTFYVLAVAENGRATAIGYQHFKLRTHTVAQELPFGETLPRGGYVVHVDAVGEVQLQKLIYRQHMQTPDALQVAVGP